VRIKTFGALRSDPIPTRILPPGGSRAALRSDHPGRGGLETGRKRGRLVVPDRPEEASQRSNAHKWPGRPTRRLADRRLQIPRYAISNVGRWLLWTRLRISGGVVSNSASGLYAGVLGLWVWSICLTWIGLHCGLSLQKPQITSRSKLPSALFILTADWILLN